jgi:hypothetical protein
MDARQGLCGQRTHLDECLRAKNQPLLHIGHCAQQHRPQRHDRIPAAAQLLLEHLPTTWLLAPLQ